MRTIAYIDGLNLYHSLEELKSPTLKWLNIRSLTESLMSKGQTLDDIHYFSAFATHRPDSYKRQRLYVAELEADGVTTHMAHFKKHDRQCFACKHKWKDHEEKETDVHIALQILEDAMLDKFDTAVIYSADSDLVPVVNAVKRLYPHKPIRVAVTNKRYRNARGMIAVCDGVHTFRNDRLKKHLFPKRNPYK